MAPDPDMPAENPALHARRPRCLPFIAEAADAVVICNTVGHIIVVNAKVESWVGYTPPCRMKSAIRCHP